MNFRKEMPSRHLPIFSAINKKTRKLVVVYIRATGKEVLYLLWLTTDPFSLILDVGSCRQAVLLRRKGMRPRLWGIYCTHLGEICLIPKVENIELHFKTIHYT